MTLEISGHNNVSQDGVPFDALTCEQSQGLVRLFGQLGEILVALNMFSPSTRTA